MNIEQIEKHEIFGVYFYDRGLLNQIDDFLIENHPMTEKIRAMRKINEIMGIDGDLSSKDVEEHIKSIKEYRFGN